MLRKKASNVSSKIAKPLDFDYLIVIPNISYYF